MEWFDDLLLLLALICTLFAGAEFIGWLNALWLLLALLGALFIGLAIYTAHEHWETRKGEREPRDSDYQSSPECSRCDLYDKETGSNLCDDCIEKDYIDAYY